MIFNKVKNVFDFTRFYFLMIIICSVTGVGCRVTF
jgi:hypothetical protein